MGVNSVFLHQFLRCAFLGNFSVIQYNDLVCTGDGPHTMCDHEHRLVTDKA